MASDDLLIVARQGPDFWLFEQPVDAVVSHDLAAVPAQLQGWERRSQAEGLWAALALSYEAGAAFETALPTPVSATDPILIGGLFPPPEQISPAALHQRWFPDGRRPEAWLAPWTAGVDQAGYNQAFAEVKAALERGQTYQVNLTLPLTSHLLPTGGQPSTTSQLYRALFLRLLDSRQGLYAAYVESRDRILISLSPELFFRQTRETPSTWLVESRPMKGTAARSADPTQDAAAIHYLKTDAKTRAENLMITDMIRNDLGRIAVAGTVSVPILFHVETYLTVHQLVSQVQARTAHRPAAVLAALFPCASITGAPKVSTIQLLQKLEPQTRGFYTGTIGWWAPDGQAQFNVAIRTLEVWPSTGQLRLGVGGGVVWDSTAADEWAEAWWKSRFVRPVQRDFALTEALLWEPGAGWFLEDYHWQRLSAAAQVWGTPIERSDWARALPAGPWSEAMKVRVLLDPDGQLSTEAAPAGQLPEPALVALALTACDTDSVFFRFKTTRRQVYDVHRAAQPDVDDIILFNQRGELTESLSANLVLEFGGRRLTPALSCGLLAGTFRQALLDQGEISEAVLTRADFYRADRIWLINSVRRWRRAEPAIE